MPDLRDETLVEGHMFVFDDLRCPECGLWRTEAEFIEQADGDSLASCYCCECAARWDIRPHRVPARLHAQVAGQEEGEVK